MLNPGKSLCVLYSALVALLLAAPFAAADTVTHTLNIPGVAQAIAINPVSNKIYIPNGIGANQLAIIDGATEAVTTVPTGTNPEAVTLNPTTNKIYVANQFSNNISVVDGATNTVTATIPVGLFPTALAVNAVTNRIYVVNFNADTVSVINGASNTVVATVPTGHIPDGIAINPISNKVYVIEHGGRQGIWEIVFPPVQPSILLSAATLQSDGSFRFDMGGAAGQLCEIWVSTNLMDWLFLTNLVLTNGQFQFVDPAVANRPYRFYHAVP